MFAGPFGRRELLVFRTLVSLVGTALSSLLFSFVFLRWGASWHTAYVGVFLSLVFIQMLTMNAMLISQMIEEGAYTKMRKIALLGVMGVVTAALWPVMSKGADLGAMETVRQARAHVVLKWFLMPFEPFAQVTTATRVFPDLLVWAAAAAGINLLLFGLVLKLDAEFRDTAVAVSQRVYNRLQRARKSGMAQSSSGKAKGRLPQLPWWGGAGPMIWRQALGAGRNSKSLVLMGVLLGVGVAAPLIVKGTDFKGFWPVFGSGLFWLTLILTMALRFDFRGDIDQMEWLKGLPLNPAALFAGQLLVPVCVAFVFQTAAFALAAHVKHMPAVMVILAFAVPVNILVFGVENAMFLLFPSRMTAMHPGDFQMFGKQILMMLVKVLATVTLGGIAAGAGALVWWATGKSLVAGGAATWLVMTPLCCLVIPLGAWAYRRFDVSLDMPD